MTMSQRKCDISLILACYDEAGHLEESVRQVISVLDSTRWVYEIIFVDDCSTDGTQGVIEKIRAEHRHKDISTLFHAKNAGRGKTVSDGFRLAMGDIGPMVPDRCCVVLEKRNPQLRSKLHGTFLELRTGTGSIALRSGMHKRIEPCGDEQ
jgi:GT2 family glycosyltransferase